MMRQTGNPPLLLTLPLAPEPAELAALQHLQEVFLDACALIRSVALKIGTRDRSLLHAYLYRQLCPLQPIPGGPRPLPAHYAVLTIGRVIHQLRAKAHRRPDPYPPDSFDVDSHVLGLFPEQGHLRIASLDSYGLRGENTKHARLVVPLQLPALAALPAEARDALARGHLRGGSLILPASGNVHLVARFDRPPEPPAPEPAPDPAQRRR